MQNTQGKKTPKKSNDTQKATSGFTEDISKEMGAAHPLPVENGFGNLSQCYISLSGPTRLFTATRYGKRYMLKCLKSDFLYTPVYRQALTKEFEIGLQLEHPNICRTIGMEDVGYLGTTIVMEYIDGDSLQELINKHALTASVAHKITAQLMDALEYMHNKQIIHRDLKPSNIMVTHNGMNVKLIDFGLSDSDAFCVLKSPAGTSGYIAPEQLLPGAKSEPRADIYSLGMVIADMAKATGDNQLQKMAEICTCRDPQSRPSSIPEIRNLSIHTSKQKAASIILSLIALLFIFIIASTYYHRNQSTKGNNAIENASDDSMEDNGNEIQDYRLWSK